MLMPDCSSTSIARMAYSSSSSTFPNGRASHSRYKGFTRYSRLAYWRRGRGTGKPVPAATCKAMICKKVTAIDEYIKRKRAGAAVALDAGSG